MPLLVFPNPTKAVLTISDNATLSGIIYIKIYDRTGKLLFENQDWQLPGNNRYQLNLGALTTGLYTLELINTIETKRAKFIVE